MKQVFFGTGILQLISINSTRYNLLQGASAWDTTENNMSVPFPTGGTLSSLRVQLKVDPGDPAEPDGYIFTLRVNGADTALTCTISADNTTGSDVAHSVDVVAGDLVDIQCVPVNSPSASTDASWSMVFTGTTANESVCLSRATAHKTTTYYGVVMGNMSYGSTAQANCPCPTSGTFKKLYVKLSADPGTDPDADTITLLEDSAASTLTCTIVADNKTGNDLANTVAVAAGNLVCIKLEPISSPSVSPLAGIGLVFLADTDGESLLLSNVTDTTATYTTEFLSIVANDVDFDSTEDYHKAVANACTIKKLYVNLSADPGTSPDAYSFTLREDKADTTLTCTVTADATTANDTAHEVTIEDGHLVDWEITPLNSPSTAVNAGFGAVCYIEPAGGESLTNDPSSKDMGTLKANTTYYAKGSAPHDPVQDGDCTYTITNDGSVAIDISIKGANFTGGAGWTLAGTPALNTVKIVAYASGTDPDSGIVLTTSDQEFIAALAASATKKWDFSITTGTFSDSTLKQSSITLSAVVS